jgi:hypothetical protein
MRECRGKRSGMASAAVSPLPREHAGAMQQQGNGAAESRSDGVRERGQHDSLGTEQQVAEMRLRQENRSGLTPELSRPAKRVRLE